MTEPFRPFADTVFKLCLFGGAVLLGFALWMGYLTVRSQYETLQHVPREQPVPFSHKHHVGDLGIDCRYCHDSVEVSSFAGIPPTATCMHCHSQLWAASPALEPVRESYRTNRSLQWTRVHELPQFVYFNHSVHTHKGIGCSSCHGQINNMQLTWQEAPLTMEWCLNCHRNPERYVRPVSEVFSMSYKPPPNQLALGKQLVREYNIHSLTSCSYCHR